MRPNVLFLRMPMHILHVPIKFTVGSEAFAAYFTNKITARHILKWFFRNRSSSGYPWESRADFTLVTKKDISKHIVHFTIKRVCLLLKGVWLHVGGYKK
jgi:hypothetical protein